MRLPPRGSAQDELLYLIHERQRETKFTEVAVLAMLLGEHSTLRQKLLKVFREELFEDSYNPAIIRARQEEVRKSAQEKVDQALLLKKASELKTPAPPPAKGKKNRGR